MQLQGRATEADYRSEKWLLMTFVQITANCYRPSSDGATDRENIRT